MIDATCDAALPALSEDLAPDAETTGAITSERVKVDVIEEETRYSSGGKGTRKRYTTAERLIRPLLTPPGRLYRS